MKKVKITIKKQTVYQDLIDKYENSMQHVCNMKIGQVIIANGWQQVVRSIAEQRSTATLSKAFKEVVADFLSKAGEQAEFDKDIFTRLVDKIIVKSRDNIIFVLKDGTAVKADL